METKEEKISIYLAGPFTSPSWRSRFKRLIKKRGIENIVVIDPRYHTKQTSSYELIKGDLISGAMASHISLIHRPKNRLEGIGDSIETGTAYASGKLLILIDKNSKSKEDKKSSSQGIYDLKFHDFEVFFDELIKKDYFKHQRKEKIKIIKRFPKKKPKLLKNKLTFFLAGEESYRNTFSWKAKLKRKTKHSYFNLEGKAPLEDIAASDVLIIYLNRQPAWIKEKKAAFHAGIAFTCHVPIFYLDDAGFLHPLLDGISYRKFVGPYCFPKFVTYLNEEFNSKDEFVATYSAARKEGLL